MVSISKMTITNTSNPVKAIIIRINKIDIVLACHVKKLFSLSYIHSITVDFQALFVFDNLDITENEPHQFKIQSIS